MFKRTFPIMLLVALLILGLVGCGPTKPSDNGADAGDMQSIIRMTQDWPTYYDPAVGSSFSCTIAMINIYDPLVFPQLDGTVGPHVATEWGVSDDGLVYTFKIRDDIKFHSGNLLKAEDVVFSMQRMLTIGEGYAYLFVDVVEDVYAEDDTTVVMKLHEPFGPFPLTLVRFMIVEKALVTEHMNLDEDTYGEFGDYGKNWMLTNDAGSGPYKTKEFQLDEYLLGERFDDYFLGWEENAPQYFKISGAVDPVSVRTAMANKELEITDEIQPIENYNTMAGFEGVDVVAYESGTNCNMMLNTKKAPTDDVHFRRALAYAVDYDVILNDIYPDSIRSVGPVPSIVPGWNSDLEPFVFDLDRAREELAKSKYADDPAMMTIDLTWCAEVPEQEKIALLIQSNLEQLGITLQVTRKPFGSMIADAQTMETTPHASFVNFAPSYFEAGATLKTRYHSSSTGSWEQMEWLQDPEIDAMIEDALSTVDLNERFQKYYDIQEKIVEIVPTVYLFNWVEKRACQTGYVDWEPYLLLKEGKDFVYPMGYSLYVRGMKVYPDKR